MRRPTISPVQRENPLESLINALDCGAKHMADHWDDWDKWRAEHRSGRGKWKHKHMDWGKPGHSQSERRAEREARRAEERERLREHFERRRQRRRDRHEERGRDRGSVLTPEEEAYRQARRTAE